MGITIQYNDVLALRSRNDPDLELREVEMIPSNLKADKQYFYLKLGYRALPLCKIIPLVETKGKQQFIAVHALVSIQSIVVNFNPLEPDNIHTSGAYHVVKLLTKAESDMWLKLLTDPRLI